MHIKIGRYTEIYQYSDLFSLKILSISDTLNNPFE